MEAGDSGTVPKMPSSVGWLSLQLSAADFPAEFEMPEHLLRAVSSLELLAQARNRHKISPRQSSDNSATEGSINKLLSTSRPLVHFLQPLVAKAVGMGIELQIVHEPGHSNISVDGLCRDFPHVMSQLDPAHRVQVSAPQLLNYSHPWTLWPNDGQWPSTIKDRVQRLAQKTGIDETSLGSPSVCSALGTRCCAGGLSLSAFPEDVCLLILRYHTFVSPDSSSRFALGGDPSSSRGGAAPRRRFLRSFASAGPGVNRSSA